MQNPIIKTIIKLQWFSLCKQMDRARLLLKAVALKPEEEETKGWPRTGRFSRVLGRQPEELAL
jgi:hypothetical protein